MSRNRGHQSVFTNSRQGRQNVFTIGLLGRQNDITMCRQLQMKVVKGSQMSQKIPKVVTCCQYGSPKTCTWQSCLSCRLLNISGLVWVHHNQEIYKDYIRGLERI